LQIKVVLPGTVDWERAVQLVSDQFRRSFDAEAEPHPDWFVASMSPDDNGIDVPRACVGQCDDVVLIDNTRVMHGRRRIEDPVREIYNALSYAK
jgi:hypothetical protein